jgi:subtilisin family serine protease
VSLSGGVLAAKQDPTTEVVVTLAGAPLGSDGPHSAHARRLAAAQAKVERNLLAAIPEATIRWRYRIVANGFAVALPQSKVPLLATVPGIARTWSNASYASAAVRVTRLAGINQGPEVIGANKLWGAGLETAGNGMKIGIIDDGVDASHKFFDAGGLSYPAGFPKGQTQYTTPKVIVQRAFAPPSPVVRGAGVPFDSAESFHATHVAGIAAGDHDTPAGNLKLSGVAPNAYLGNYKALTIETPNFGLDGNAAEITAAIEAAVADGMNVINLSLGEPEVEPKRDIVVAAIEGAARAGVVPVVAAGNDFSDFGQGSISSPGNAPSAITVAAVTTNDVIASFSSAGPTPISLKLKPDVSAPGVGIVSALPENQGGPWGPLEGTSMAAPQVAGGAALLKQQHPGWTVAQVKSALVQTADPVGDGGGSEVSVLREGGGLVNLPRALNPLLFAAPTGISFPVNGGPAKVALTDAGGGAGSWTVKTHLQNKSTGVTVTAPATVSVPGTLQVSTTVADAARSGAVTGFVTLTHGADTRRIPFLVIVTRPALATGPVIPLVRPGVHSGTTVGAPSRVREYRYPSAGDTSYPGPEVIYRVRITGRVANFGVATIAGRAVPHVIYAGDENHLTGYAGLPVNLNPYFDTFGDQRPIAGAILPLPGTYDIVFDTRGKSLAGPFQFRYWVNDTKPPTFRVLPGAPGTIAVAITDAASGVDPRSLVARLDGREVHASYANGKAVIRATPGKHTVSVQASDYQETKNMEDVVKIKPNTATMTRSVTVR